MSYLLTGSIVADGAAVQGTGWLVPAGAFRLGVKLNVTLPARPELNPPTDDTATATFSAAVQRIEGLTRSGRGTLTVAPRPAFINLRAGVRAAVAELSGTLPVGTYVVTVSVLLGGYVPVVSGASFTDTVIGVIRPFNGTLTVAEATTTGPAGTGISYGDLTWPQAEWLARRGARVWLPTAPQRFLEYVGELAYWRTINFTTGAVTTSAIVQGPEFTEAEFRARNWIAAKVDSALVDLARQITIRYP